MPGFAAREQQRAGAAGTGMTRRALQGGAGSSPTTTRGAAPGAAARLLFHHARGPIGRAAHCALTPSTHSPRHLGGVARSSSADRAPHCAPRAGVGPTGLSLGAAWPCLAADRRRYGGWSAALKRMRPMATRRQPARHSPRPSRSPFETAGSALFSSPSTPPGSTEETPQPRPAWVDARRSAPISARFRPSCGRRDHRHRRPGRDRVDRLELAFQPERRLLRAIGRRDEHPCAIGQVVVRAMPPIRSACSSPWP